MKEYAGFMSKVDLDGYKAGFEDVVASNKALAARVAELEDAVRHHGCTVGCAAALQRAAKMATASVCTEKTSGTASPASATRLEEEAATTTPARGPEEAGSFGSPEIKEDWDRAWENASARHRTSDALPKLHCYDHSEGAKLVMRCGAVSEMPEHSAPYVDTRRAFLGFSETERCDACSASLKEVHRTNEAPKDEPTGLIQPEIPEAPGMGCRTSSYSRSSDTQGGAHRPDKPRSCSNCDDGRALLCSSCVKEQIEEAVDHFISDDGNAHCHGCITGSRMTRKCPGVPRSETPEAVTARSVWPVAAKAFRAGYVAGWDAGERGHDYEEDAALAKFRASETGSTPK